MSLRNTLRSFRRALSAFAPVAVLLLAGLPSAPALAQTVPVWELSRDGRTGYLIASIHVGRPEFYPVPRTMRDAFEWSDVFALEFDPRRPELQRAIERAGIFPAGSTLEKAIGTSEWQKLQPVLARLRLPAEEAQREKPWLLASTLTLLAQSEAGYLPDLAIDAGLLRTAVATGRPIVELDRFEAQAPVLEELSQKHGAAWVARVAEQVQSGKSAEGIGRLVEAWRAGDLGEVANLLERETAGDSAATEIARRIAEVRSRTVAGRIVEVLAEGRRPLFVVHVANLAGAEGVMARITKAGVRTRQVTLGTEIPLPPGAAKPAAGGAPGAAPTGSGAAQPLPPAGGPARAPSK
jgi:hypothetical protein